MLTPPFIHDHGDSFELPRKSITFAGRPNAAERTSRSSQPATSERGGICPKPNLGFAPLHLSELISDPFYDSCRQDADWDRPGAGLSGGDAGANCNFHGDAV